MSWISFGILSAVFAALVTIFSKIGLKAVDPGLATSIRVVIMAVFFFFVSLFSGKFSQLHTISGKAMWFIVLGAISGALSWLFYFYALAKGPAGSVAALDRLSIVFIVLLAALFLSEKLTWQTGGGALLILLGTIFMVWKF